MVQFEIVGSIFRAFGSFPKLGEKLSTFRLKLDSMLDIFG